MTEKNNNDNMSMYALNFVGRFMSMKIKIKLFVFLLSILATITQASEKSPLDEFKEDLLLDEFKEDLLLDEFKEIISDESLTEKAIRESNVVIVQELINTKKLAFKACAQYPTALFLALVIYSFETVNEKDTDEPINKKGALEIIKILAACEDIDINAKDSENYSVLDRAISSNYAEVVEVLLLNSQKKLECVYENLHTIVMRGYSDSLEILLKNADKINLDWNAKTNKGNTILHLAVQENNVEIVKLLLGYADKINLDWNAKNNKGNTILHRAVQENNVEIVKLLLGYADKITLRWDAKNNKGYTALERAKSQKKNDIITFFSTNISSNDNQSVNPDEKKEFTQKNKFQQSTITNPDNTLTLPTQPPTTDQQNTFKTTTSAITNPKQMEEVQDNFVKRVNALLNYGKNLLNKGLDKSVIFYNKTKSALNSPTALWPLVTVGSGLAVLTIVGLFFFSKTFNKKVLLPTAIHTFADKEPQFFTATPIERQNSFLMSKDGLQAQSSSISVSPVSLPIVEVPKVPTLLETPQEHKIASSLTSFWRPFFSPPPYNFV